MDFASSAKASENGTRWKGLLRIHLWCPDNLLTSEFLLLRNFSVAISVSPTVCLS